MSAKNRGSMMMIKPAELTIHPQVEIVPMMSDHAFELLKADILETGAILDAIRCHRDAKTGKLLVIDGRHRVKIATEAKITAVPVVVDNSLDPLKTALASAIARRQLTKSGIALHLFEAHPELREQRTARGKTNQLRKKNFTSGEALEKLELPSFNALEKKYGLPERYLSKLTAIWEEATEKEWPVIRDEILAGQIEIPAKYAGIKGRVATKGGKRKPPQFHFLLKRALVSELPNRLRGWPQLKQTEKDEIYAEFKKQIKKFPKDFCQQFGGLLTEHASNDRND